MINIQHNENKNAPAVIDFLKFCSKDVMLYELLRSRAEVWGEFGTITRELVTYDKKYLNQTRFIILLMRKVICTQFSFGLIWFDSGNF